MDDAPIERLRALVRHATFSHEGASRSAEALAAFHDELRALFPLVHEKLDREVVGSGSLLYRWRGFDKRSPAVLMAHQDVVAVDDDTRWTHPPFAAELAGDGDEAAVWGRGTLDDKGALGAILEAVEARLHAGFTPASDIYLMFGHDEESGGSGAAAMVALLASRGISPGLVVDEGGAVMSGLLPGLGPTAVVGLTEKGLMNVELAVEQPGGHAAIPIPGGSAAVLARAILRLEHQPEAPRLIDPIVGLLEALGSRIPGPRGWMLRHARTFRGPLARIVAGQSPLLAAMTRTTRAVTQLRGSSSRNVVPELATATVNVRILPGSTVETARADIVRLIDDPAVRVRVLEGNDPPPVSRAEGPEWEALVASILEVFPDAAVAPYVMLQASDARHASRISENVYRFLPFDLRQDELDTIHGIDEHIRVSTYRKAIAFFDALIGRL
ncbi:M20/M25/M40 family metallo-hydrolase [Homoserinibacter sp. GY 40078]|uniref:M20/M25/M40 family metallo-hydrolase n=1 Tax=Homoserinibacter sp. GY 40078 TaxID=2603275 RepID=UPI0011CC5CFE|nr:M20/M25/M40 family metallo-hydrolase [Homoserinibacter sp. GY 40078]TXK17333.1 M20/M25/M40 family metallo-hydrolase [Homoserinibacter sp. GY 40078]